MTKKGVYLISRDHIGIVPLYYGYDEHDNFYVASELKALIKVCRTIQEFPPGHYYYSEQGKFVRYYNPDWQDYNNVKNNQTDKKLLKRSLEDAMSNGVNRNSRRIFLGTIWRL